MLREEVFGQHAGMQGTMLPNAVLPCLTIGPEDFETLHHSLVAIQTLQEKLSRWASELVDLKVASYTSVAHGARRGWKGGNR